MFRHRRLSVLLFSLLIILFATLGAQDVSNRGSQENENVHRALEVLRDAIIDGARTNTTDPIAEALKALWNFEEVDTTDFWLRLTDDAPFETCHRVADSFNLECADWSSDRPPGVTPEEWKRFGRLLNGASFTSRLKSYSNLWANLVDLNDDGLRDLFLLTPPWGTTGWEYTYVFQNDDVKGFLPVVCKNGEPCSFFAGGRGLDVNLYLLRINARNYFAVRKSAYGEEVITLHGLLLSTDHNDAYESVRVRYDITHRLDVDAFVKERNADTRPDGPDIDPAVFDQLNLIFENRAEAAKTTDRCPVPADQRDQVRNDLEKDPDTYWPWINRIPYTQDRHDVFAVKTPAACYQAQVMSIRANGFYSRRSTDCCRVELQEGPFSPSINIPLETHRTFKGAELTPFSGNILR